MDVRRHGLRLAIAILLAPVPAALRRSPCDEPLLPEAFAPLEAAARDVAAAGRIEELNELLLLLRSAGREGAACDKLATPLRAQAAKVKHATAPPASTVKSLAKLAGDVAKGLGQRPDATRPAVARFVLALDDQSDAAHAALGFERAGAEWLDAAAKKRAQRREAIAAAVTRARQLEIPITVDPATHPLARGADGQPLNHVRYEQLSLFGDWSNEKLARVLRETMRALAVDHFLISDDLSIPAPPRRSFLFFGNRAEYLAAAAVAREQKIASTADLELVDRLIGVFVGRDYIGYDVAEAAVACRIHSHNLINIVWEKGFKIDSIEPTLRAGLENWTDLSVLGERMPLFVVDQVKETSVPGGATTDLTDEQRRRRERLLLLSEAGIQGGREWMRYLAARREDPPFAATFRDQIGRIQGEDLLKTTFVVEMLMQDGPLADLLKRSPAAASGQPREKAFTTAIGRPLPGFEEEWRSWFVPPRAGLVQRLAESPARAPTASDETQAVDYLNQIRARACASKTTVDLDAAASRDCAQHIAYLAKNPTQLDRWPDIHEEYADHPGFTVAGAGAGGRSVIATGVPSSKVALDEWMATYYHRLPLLSPGLVRIGVAFGGKTSVLDCGSFVRPLEDLDTDQIETVSGKATWWGVPWPPPGASDVPTRFRAELPHPVPGEDETKMGYPVTFQLSNTLHCVPIVAIELHEGTASGKVVPAYCSAPNAPTNPVLAPDAAWCLIPKQPLQPGANYTVTFSIEVTERKRVADQFSWSFRCGK